MIYNNKMLLAYLNGLVGNVFKIIPLYEEENIGIKTYVESLLKGLFELEEVIHIECHFEYITLLNTLKSVETELSKLDSEHHIVRRESLKSIDIIKNMRRKIQRNC